MVLSKLDKSINYKETKKINEDDIDFETSVYSGNLFEKYIEFSIGKPKYFYIEQNIIFFYIYLVNKSFVILNIGVFEIESNNYPNIIDEDGNIIMEKLTSSLIFEFVENFINKHYNVQNLSNIDSIKNQRPTVDKISEIREKDEKTDEDLDNKIDKLKISKTSENTIKLKEESKEDNDEQKRIFIENKDNYWVEDFFNNNNYSVKDNEAGGDCLFAAIRDGLEGTEKKISVLELRKKLSEEVNKEIFDSYKEKFEMFFEQYNLSKERLKEFAKRHSELKDLLKINKLKEDQVKIVIESKEINKQFLEEKDNNVLLKSLLEEFKFMKNINSIEEFKNYIKKDSSCQDVFWGDSWAISTLERLINIKLILLSQENYKNGDLNNVLLCGQLNDSILESEGKFEPSYYLILDYNGYHYQLVTYKKHRSFNFTEIPYGIKQLIVIKCLERQSGAFYIIPEFKNFAKKYNVDEKFLAKDIELEEPTNLYDSDIVFQFYIKSNGKLKPGKGNGEKIPDDKIKEFSRLSKIENWRRKLSNLWDENIINIGGKNWKSVEHFYQANKFKKNNPEYFEKFSLDSDSELSKDPILAKAAGSVSGKLNGKQIRPVTIKIDVDFSKKKDLILEEALFAKFTQSEELKNLIINTKNAKLLNYQVADKAVVAEDLMKVRRKIIS